MGPDAPLRVALGRTPATEPLFTGAARVPGVDLALASHAAISRAFAPMVREGAYDVSELAIATFLMAKEAGRPLVLLPVVLASRGQERALLCRADSSIASPRDLRGARVGVRSYSQTTALWLRGSLRERYGLEADSLAWTTFEDAHVSGFTDPPWCSRAPSGATLQGLLADGTIDAAIFGLDLPSDDALRTVLPDPDAEAHDFVTRHGFVPVNHLLVAGADVARDRPDSLVALVDALRRVGASVLPRRELAPALAVASRFALEQGLVRTLFAADALWNGTPAAFA